MCKKNIKKQQKKNQEILKLLFFFKQLFLFFICSICSKPYEVNEYMLYLIILYYKCTMELAIIRTHKKIEILEAFFDNSMLP